jgi:hypothetical protein
MAHFLPCTETITAEETAALFLHGVYRSHGLPRVLISDRDPKFVSGFWQTLWRRLGTLLNMSSSRHPEADGLTERVNNTFQQLLRCFFCYDGSDWTTLLAQVEFAYNTSRALGVEHTPFEANFGLSPEEPLDMMFSIRPSILVSQDATERLRLLKEIHTIVRSLLKLHKDEMHKTVYSATLCQRRQGVSRHNTYFSTRTAQQETQRQTAWTFCSGGANWETQSQIETSSDNTLTSGVPCENFTTVLCRSTTTNCPGDCS